MSALYAVEVDEMCFADEEDADRIAQRLIVLEEALLRVPQGESALVVLSASFFRVTAPLMAQIALRECLERTRMRGIELVLGVETSEGLEWAPLEHEPRRTVHHLGREIETIVPGELTHTTLGPCAVLAGRSVFDRAIHSAVEAKKPRLVLALSAGVVGPRWTQTLSALEEVAPTFAVGAMHRNRQEHAAPRNHHWVYSANWRTTWGRIRQYRQALRAEDSTTAHNEAMMSAL